MTEPAGVGPWPGGNPRWPDDPRYDPELLERGDHRNVLDKYRYWRREAIVADLDQYRHPFHVAIENYQHDFNIGTIVRNANAFGAGAVHIIGERKWNRRGAMVTDRYQHVHHHPLVADFSAWAKGEKLVVIGIDILPNSKPLIGAKLPDKCVLLFGQEGPGLSLDAQPICKQILHIPQFGSTRSINVGVASGVAMYEWTRQNAIIPKSE